MNWLKRNAPAVTAAAFAVLCFVSLAWAPQWQAKKYDGTPLGLYVAPGDTTTTGYLEADTAAVDTAHFLKASVHRLDGFRAGVDTVRSQIDSTVALYVNTSNTDKGYGWFENYTLNTASNFWGIYGGWYKKSGASNQNDYLNGMWFDVSMNQPGGVLGGLYGFAGIAELANGQMGTPDTSRYLMGGEARTNAVGGTLYGSMIGFFNEAIAYGTVDSITGDAVGTWVHTATEHVGGSTYGILLDDDTGTDWGIYQTGTSPNYLWGLQLGDSLDVAGNVHAAAYYGDGSNLTGVSGVSDHGSLTGLDDPADHPWALQAADARDSSLAAVDTAGLGTRWRSDIHDTANVLRGEMETVFLVTSQPECEERNGTAASGTMDNVTRALTSDDQRADTGNANATLIVRKFGYSLAAGISADSITIHVEGTYNNGGMKVGLTTDGATLEGNWIDTVYCTGGGDQHEYSTADAAKAGFALTAEAINDTLFGVICQYIGFAALSVDHISMTVCTAPEPPYYEFEYGLHAPSITVDTLYATEWSAAFDSAMRAALAPDISDSARAAAHDTADALRNSLLLKTAARDSALAAIDTAGLGTRWRADIAESLATVQGGVTDHGDMDSLSLLDDDHPQYLLRDDLPESRVATWVGTLDSIASTGSGKVPTNSWSLTGDDTYIYVACETKGLMSFSRSSGVLTKVDSVATNAHGAWAYGGYVYSGYGTKVYSWSVTAGMLAKVDSVTVPNGNIQGMHGARAGGKTWIYASAGGPNGELNVIEDEGAGNITLRSTKTGPTGYAQGVWADSLFVFFTTGTSGIYSYSNNGSGTLTQVSMHDPGSQSAVSVWGTGSRIYVAYCEDGLRSYRRGAGGSFAWFATGARNAGFGNYTDVVYTDSTWIYTGQTTNYEAVAAFHVIGIESVPLIDFYSRSPNVRTYQRTIWGDGTYIYWMPSDRIITLKPSY